MDKPTFTLPNMYGNDELQKRARSALPILIQTAKSRRTITYGELGERINVPPPYHHHQNMGDPLGCIWITLYELQGAWEEQGHLVDIPRLTWIVVSKEKGLPTGISRPDFEAEREKIFNFPMWTSVQEAIEARINSQC